MLRCQGLKTFLFARAPALPMRSLSVHDDAWLRGEFEFGSRRHSATLLPIGATVSAFGVLRDDRTFDPYRDVPLLETFATRAERVRTAARREGWWFAFALLFPYIGVLLAGSLAAQACGPWQPASPPG
ncbi:MAG TPA: hypothetical protein ENI87_07985 [bacterium]|nr:hypothetical protein [bacterium]